jgi:glycosyltransferase involved in cell wall biosynthesis
VLTWGLISAGKGIEYGIEAVARLGDLEPRPRYVVIGQTHPEVIRREGEAYRESLRARVSELHADDLVEFDNGYLDAGSILARIRDADVVLLPYLSREQVVSGVLVEAIASGKPVVATRFPHAVELLGEGSGVLVPHEDTDAISAALRSLLTDRGHAAEAAAVARRQAPRFFWENVARAYRRLAVRATRRHLEATQYVV